MKKYFMYFAAALASAALFASCGDDEKPDGPDGGNTGKVPVVSISADKTFGEGNTATATLTLSEASDKDVVVKLAKADVQEGQNKISADFDKKVTIKAGETSAVTTIKADTFGKTDGDYQFALKIDSAEGATVADNSVVYIGINFVFKPTVNLSADRQFADDLSATITVSLDKKLGSDVTLKIVLDPSSQVEVKFDGNVVVPAGQTSVEVPLTVVIPDGLKAGVYPAIFNVDSIENGILGANSSVTINLSFPFGATVLVDGIFDDWASVSTVATLPDDAAFIALKTLKLAASSDKLFIYLEVDEREGLSFGMPADFFIDADGNTSTGGKLTSTDNENEDLPYTDSGVEWYIEHGAFHDAGSATGYYDWSQGGAYHYEGADGAGVFSGLSDKTGQYGAAQMFAVGKFDEATMTGQVEIMLDREYFGITGEKASVGVKLMDGMNKWACYGLLPQGAKKSAGHHTAADMLTINLPVYAK